MSKHIRFYLILLLLPATMKAQPIQIIDSDGWLESAFVTWTPDTLADSYLVYYSGMGITDKKIDAPLIRNYGDYYRADVLGLKPGTYTLSVVPIIAGTEGEAAVTAPLTVEGHDRTGFAFSNGRVPGAYKADGTEKDDVVILYITQNSKNTISLEVTGANENPCIGLQAILEGFKKGKELRPLIIRLIGQITDLDYMAKGDIVLENDNNALSCITLEGVGDDAVADGWGIRVKNAVNIEIRNIGTMNCNSTEADNIGLQQNNEYIWVHHCDFFYGDAGPDADQAKGDGALDCKTSGFVTISYNHFWDTGKSNLLGNGTEDPRHLSYHHNWYDHSDSRHPRVRSHSVHVFNNYYDGNSKYGVGATNASSVFVEANYFRNCVYPMLISMQGSDVFDESTQTNDYSDRPTFSKEDGGSIKAFNNYMTGQRRFVAYGDAAFPNATVDFDAYVASDREETVPSQVLTFKGANRYNNFDTNPDVMYAYTPDPPEVARVKVLQYAGRLDGGDFSWTFDDAVDDASYEVDAGLKAALAVYRTKLVSIQGDSIDESEPSEGDLIHNFTLSGKNSTFYTITGNLSDSKGTVIYDGLTLTQCLKMESSTLISFTTTQEATLTLVFNPEFSGTIKINGASLHAIEGILTMVLPAGSYEITKGDVANLFYMSLVYNGSAVTMAEVPDLILYPNPVTDYLSIAGAEDIEKIAIYSMTGHLERLVEECGKFLDLSDLQDGYYLVLVYSAKGLFRHIVLKE